MSKYVAGREPKCAGGSPNCLGIIRSREAKTCVVCSRWINRSHGLAPEMPAEALAADRQRTIERAEATGLKAKYAEALKQIEARDRELADVRAVNTRSIDPVRIVPSVGSKGDNEASVVLMASDWHSEEIVNPATINYKNAHSLEIHKHRQERYWQKALGLIRLIEAGVKVPTIVLALLGDFITNEIHDADSAENNALSPVDAIMMVEDEIAGGIYFLLNHTKAQIIVDTHSGNHARTTRKVRIANERGHSLEHYMYSHLARLFADEPRVTFRVNEGYHSFMNIYSVPVRLHHGHAVNYQGGVGGITIPVNKAIAEWNKETTVALDLFGHFHRAFDGGNFVANGSMIGYNAFAKFIKAPYEVPKQMMLVIDKKHGRTCTWPIYVQKENK